jgi:hypothetical protein
VLRFTFCVLRSTIDDTLVAHAIVTDLLPRETIPAESLLEALQPILAFYEREQEAE